MIYGRRLFDKGLEGPFRRKPVHRVFKVVNSQFQWKYTWYFNAFLLGSLFLFIGPSWYFLHQNYDIVIGIAGKTAPQLIEHLQRELQWLIGFSIFSVLSLLLLTTWVSLKMTGNIVGPLISMERHMWKVTTGDWSMNDFRIRAEDDFRELADAYSYMYRSLKAQAEAELQLLQQINVDASQKDSYNSMAAMINLKRAQLNVQPDASPGREALPVPVTGDRRRVS